MLKLKTSAWKIKLQKSEKSSYSRGEWYFQHICLIKELKLNDILKFLQINKQEEKETNITYISTWRKLNHIIGCDN